MAKNVNIDISKIKTRVCDKCGSKIRHHSNELCSDCDFTSHRIQAKQREISLTVPVRSLGK